MYEINKNCNRNLSFVLLSVSVVYFFRGVDVI